MAVMFFFVGNISGQQRSHWAMGSVFLGGCGAVEGLAAEF